MKYVKKPIPVEAFQLNVPSGEWPAWFRTAISEGVVTFDIDGNCLIKTLEGTHYALPTDFIIQGVRGELYADQVRALIIINSYLLELGIPSQTKVYFDFDR